MKSILTFLFLLFFLSPYAQHNWVRTNPGGGGAIATVGATASGTILAASDLSGIYRSYDNGQTWDVVGASQGLVETHISSLGFDPNDGNVFFAGTYRGVYKTTDGGEHFTFVFPSASHSFEFSYIEDIAIAASNSDIGYLTHHLDTESSGDIYKTTDGGASWNAIIGEDLPNDLRLIKIMVHPTDANIVYVLTGKSRWGCSEANLYRSNNGGIHWVEMGADQGEILDMDLHPTNPDIVFISTFESLYEDNESCRGMTFDDYISENDLAGAFYKSTNGGTSFIEIGDKTGIISVGLDNPDIIRLMDVLYPYDWNDDAGTWETTDGGNTWTHTGFRQNWKHGYTENQYYAYSKSFNGLNKTVTKDLFNSDRFYGSYGQWAWGSFDGGVTFNNISTKEVSPNHWISTGVENVNGHCIEVNESNPNVVYIGAYDMGFWYTTDHGISWTRTQPNYNIYAEYSWGLGTPPIDEDIAKRGAGANVSTILSDPMRENVVWAAFSKDQLTDPLENNIANTGLFKSTNYGEDWTLVDNGLPAFAQSVKMYGLSLDNTSSVSNRTMFVTVDGDVYRSTTDGVSWQMVLNNGDLKFIEVDKFNGNIVYAGGKVGLWRSMDGGNNWTEVGTADMRNSNTNTRPDIAPTWTDWSGAEPVFEYEGIFDIQTDPNIPNRVYATAYGANKGLFRSDDAGENWNHILTDADMRGVAIAPQNSNLIYATSSKSYTSGGFGQSLGVLYSSDAGETWQEANEGMAFHYGGMIEVETGANPYVWTWSPGTGVQRAKVPQNLLTQVTAIEEVSFLEKIELFPNPNNGEFTIHLQGEPSDELEISLFNQLGQVILKEKIDFHLGKISKSFYLQDLSAASYILQIKSKGQSIYRKVMKKE